MSSTDSQPTPTVPSWSQRRDEVRKSRIESIYATWYELIEDIDEPLDVRISPSRVAEAVENYLKDAEGLINRHNIQNGRVQHHKVAGLIAANVIKFSPVVAQDDTEVLKRESYDNQILALWHGLSVTFQEAPEALDTFTKSLGFKPWFKRMMELLKRRIECAETLVGVFDTLASIYLTEAQRTAPEAQKTVS